MMAEMIRGLNVVLLGRSGIGKSASGNTILGKEAFKSKKSSTSVTRDVAVESGRVCGRWVTVFDTPGLFNTELSDDEIQHKLIKTLQRCESDPCVFLLVIKADRFTEKERETVEKIEELLGDERLKKTWILFTRGDELEEDNMTIEEFINQSEPLKKVIQKYDQRYHVFNNNQRGHTEQVQMLFMKVLKPYFDIQKGEVLEIWKPKPLVRKIPQYFEPAAPVSSLPSRRLVLLGKSGVGKSAAGNTVLGQREFISVQRMSSVTSVCSESHVTVSGRSVSVVDTPGFFDTQMKPEELAEEIARSVYLSSPGPHAFLIVFPVNMRFTEQEQKIPPMIEMMFGQEVFKYSIILFTHGDLLEDEPIEDLIKENSRLRDLVQQCGGRYHVFNNKDLNNREQVNDLLQKIDSMIEQNGGGHYSNQIYEDAQRFRREEEEQRKQQEEMERERKETEERFRAEYEAKRSELERLQAERQRNEEKRRREEEQIQEEMERVRKEIKIIKEKETSGFKSFFTKYKHVFTVSLVTVASIVAAPLVFIGAVVGAAGGIGAVLGAAAGMGAVRGAVEGAGAVRRAVRGPVECAGAVRRAVAGAVGGIVVVRGAVRADGNQRRQRMDEERKPQEKIQIQETEERVRAKMEADRSERERLRADRLSSRRLVLLGKSGVGKSAAGNTILGQREFNSVMSMSSVTSVCSESHVTVSGRSVSVVDTPGFFDTQMKPEELAEEIARSVYLSSPGPHAFLIVFPVNMRFTEQEQKIPQLIEMMFGQGVLKYSFILFTHGDLLEGQSVEKLIKENSRLRDLVQQCGGRYHIFNNRDLNNREQVNDLLQKIDSMIEQNGGGHYSNQMYEDAQRFRREEEEQRKQQEEMERERKETEERFRAEYEAKRSELERLQAERQRDEEKRRREEEQMQEEMERIRAKMEAERSELERLRAERQIEEEKQKDSCVCS